MLWNWKSKLNGIRYPEGDDKPGGGGGDGKDTGGNKELSELKAANAALEKRLAALEGAKPPVDDPSNLKGKAKDEIDAKEKADDHNKKLEAAIQFKLGSKEWLKTNDALLPKTIQGIFDQADKQKYDSPLEKDAVIKMNIIDEFFSIKTNLDVLTQGQKTILEDFMKLTNTKKQEKAQGFYETIFEPTLEAIKQVKKAQQLNSGSKDQTDGEKALAERMMKMSKKHYLGDKENA